MLFQQETQSKKFYKNILSLNTFPTRNSRENLKEFSPMNYYFNRKLKGKAKRIFSKLFVLEIFTQNPKKDSQSVPKENVTFSLFPFFHSTYFPSDLFTCIIKY